MFEWLIANPWAFWLTVTLVLGVIEMFSLEFFCLMLAGGSLAAALTSVTTHNWVIQVLVFAVVSLVLLLVVRPSLINRLHANTPDTKNNAEALLGQRVEVLESVTGLGGLVRLEGEAWSAQTSSGSVIPLGAMARVVEIDGATAVVEPESSAQKTYPHIPQETADE